MTTPTVAVSCHAGAANGPNLQGVRFSATLVVLNSRGLPVPASEVYGGIVVPVKVEAVTDASGDAVLNLFPNSLGTQGSQWRVTGTTPDGVTFLDAQATVPNAACNLHQVLHLQPAPALSDAQAASDAAQAAAAQVQNVVNGTGFQAVLGALDTIDLVVPHVDSIDALAPHVANIDAVASHAANVDLVAGHVANIDLVAPHVANIDAVAPHVANIDAVAARAANVDTVAGVAGAVTTVAGVAGAVTTVAGNIAPIQASPANAALATAGAASAAGYALTAAAAAAATAVSATQALSVVQQDLSGPSGVPLYRSPNAPGCNPFTYDMTRESDGGLWPQRMMDRSWMTEALQAGGLLSPPSPDGWNGEIDARGSGATVGAEVVPDPQFASPGSWTQGSGWSIAGGKASVAANTANADLTYTLGASGLQGAFLFTVVIDTMTAGQLQLRLPGGTMKTFNGPGTYTFVGNNGTFGTTIVMRAVTANSVATVSKVSVKQVTALNTVSGNWFQDAVDGKWKRLWKNLLQGSSTFAAGSGWTVTDSTPTDNAMSAPDGTPLSLITEGSAGTSTTSQTVTPLYYNTPLALRTLIARGNNDWVRLEIGDTTFSTGTYRCWINTNTGVLGTANTSGAQPPTVVSPVAISAKGGGVYEVTLTVKLPFGSAGVRVFNCNADNSSTRVANSTRYQGGFSLEHGSAFTGLETKAALVATTTEVFRGSVAKFPHLWTAVPDTSRIAIMDLTNPGRPMWKVLTGATNNGLGGTGSISAMTYKDGKLIVAITSAGLFIIDFVADRIERWTTAGRARYNGTIAQANSGLGWTFIDTTKNLLGNGTNAVAVMVRNGAPTDPATGLPVPTIGVTSTSTGGLGSVIMDDGSLVNYSQSGVNGNTVAFTKRGELAWGAGAVTYVLPLQTANVATTGSVSGIRTYSATSSVPIFGTNASHTLTTAGNVLVRASTNANQVDIMRENPSTPTASAVAKVTGLYNTGYLVGDIRRALMIDTVTGATSGEQVTNGGFGVDTSGWTQQFGAISAVGGRLRCTADGVNPGRATFPIACLVGRRYLLSFEKYKGTDTLSSVLIAVTANTNVGGIGELNDVTDGVRTIEFTATQTTHYIMCRGLTATNGVYTEFDNVSLKELVADRSIKSKPLAINGTLTMPQFGVGGQVVGYSGWSASNYLQEAYSSDLDFALGALTASVVVNFTTPTNFATGLPTWVVGQPELVVNGDFTTDTSGWTPSNCTLAAVAGELEITSTGATAPQVTRVVTGLTIGRTYVISSKLRSPSGVNIQASIATANGNGFISTASTSTQTAANSFQAVATTVTISVVLSSTAAAVKGYVDDISIKESLTSVIFERSAATGAYWKLMTDAGGRFIGEISDGTTVRRATTFSGYGASGVGIQKVRLSYTTDGAVTLSVNGDQVAQATGTALLTLTNATAVLTVGMDRLLSCVPFPGMIGYLKIGATVPSSNYGQWIWSQEKEMFMDGAQSTLPDTGSIVGYPDYDDLLDRLKVATAANETTFQGLVRSSTAAVGGTGAFTKASLTSGVKCVARTTFCPGVDVSFASKNLREELQRRAEDAARLSRLTSRYNFDTIGFTATTANANNQLTSVAVTTGTPYVGMFVSGTGIPAGAFIQAINGATYTLSANATAAGTAVPVSQCDFILQPGYEFQGLTSNRLEQREGSGKDWTRRFDGFVESALFTTSPGNGIWVQAEQKRAA